MLLRIEAVGTCLTRVPASLCGYLPAASECSDQAECRGGLPLCGRVTAHPAPGGGCCAIRAVSRAGLRPGFPVKRQLHGSWLSGVGCTMAICCGPACSPTYHVLLWCGTSPPDSRGEYKVVFHIQEVVHIGVKKFLTNIDQLIMPYVMSTCGVVDHLILLGAV